MSPTSSNLNLAKRFERVMQLAKTRKIQIIWEPPHSSNVESAYIKIMDDRALDGVRCYSMDAIVSCIEGMVHILRL